MKAKITIRSVDAMQPPAKGEAMLWDSEIKGFGLRCRCGGEKTYILGYRAGAGGRKAPYRKYTIGRHGSPWTPEQARDEAKRILGQVTQGADPAAIKKELRAAETMADLAVRFMDDHVRAMRKDRTAAEYQRLIDNAILPTLGKLRIVELTRADVSKLHRSLRGTRYQANRVLAVLSSMLNKAESWGLRPDHSNPCNHIEKYKETARSRMLSADELARLGPAIAACDAVYARAAIKLLLFTGARKNEILTLQWQHVDFERGEANLSDSKTGAKTLHLPPPALEILQSLERVAGNPFAIIGQKSGTHLVNLEKQWYGIRKAAGLDDVRIHDLRHAFASVGASSGEGLHMIGKLLGHSQAATTARYAHLQSDPMKMAAAGIAGKLEAAMRGKSADIVELKRA
ncbi:site-specific integrase [Acidocella sp.]|uniref:site-specific integrase n=1 Tax=Acidocella sp. TaxID=50710 RepID=UPI0017DAC4E4|nr:site-specific integrase [Acidocella sp.]NNM56302.1 tyrosine-type recombinase/integrase [Acidocella sp.]